MEITEIRVEDIEKVAKMWLRLAEMMEKHSKLNELDENADEEALEGFQKLFSDDRYTIFKGTQNRQIIGFMVLKKDKQDARKMRHYTKVSDLYIKEQHRNQGNGSKFLQKAEKWAEKQGCSHLKVSTEWKNTEAREFYKENDYAEKQVEYAKIIKKEN